MTIEPKAILRLTSVSDLREAIAFLRLHRFFKCRYQDEVLISTVDRHGLRADSPAASDDPIFKVIPDVDHQSEAANTVARLLERASRAPVAIEWVQSAGTSCRSVDSIVFQLEGEATITTARNVASRSARVSRSAVRLTVGRTAYVPGSSKFSVTTHLASCQIVATPRFPTDVDFRHWLSTTLRRPDRPAERVPVGASLSDRAEFIDRVGAELTRALASPSIFERFSRYQDRQAAPRPALDGSDQLVDADRQSVVVAATRVLALTRQSKDDISFDFGSVRIIIPAVAAPILRFVQDHDPVAVATVDRAFEDCLPASEINRFLQDLADRRVLSFISSETNDRLLD